MNKFDINCPFFTLNGIETWARVSDVYDGDTITIIFELFDNIYYKFNARLSHLDTCEIRSGNETVKHLALKARSRLFELVTGTSLPLTATRKETQFLLSEKHYLVWCHCHDFDKYGRVLIDVFKNNEISQISFSKILIDEKLGYLYQGNAKLSDEEKIKILQDTKKESA
jgi:endonuclease YncB( thermonuclease family)